MISNSPFEKYINGPSHHTLHHLYFTVNCTSSTLIPLRNPCFVSARFERFADLLFLELDGQYFTFADKYNGSFRAPATGEDPLIAVLAEVEASEKRSSLTAAASDDSSISSSSSETSDDDSGFEEVTVTSAIKHGIKSSRRKVE
jgi:lathosterol oxidase